MFPHLIQFAVEMMTKIKNPPANHWGFFLLLKYQLSGVDTFGPPLHVTNDSFLYSRTRECGFFSALRGVGGTYKRLNAAHMKREREKRYTGILQPTCPDELWASS